MTKLRKEISIASTLLALVALSFSCSGQMAENNGSGEASTDGVASLDLISLHGAARQWRETGIINLSSPLSHYYLVRGWSRPYSLEENGIAITAAVSEESVLRYSVIKPVDRWLAFNIRPQGIHGGPNWQRIELFAGERPLFSFEISGEAEQPQFVRIPAEVQKPGDNDISFHFSVVVKNEKFLTEREIHNEFPYPGIAAYFSDFRIYLGDTEAPRRAEIRDETQAIQPVLNDRYLSQMPNSVLSYAFGIKKGSRLIFAGTMRAPRGEEGVVEVSVQARTDSETELSELWSRDFSISPESLVHNFDATLPLDAFDGKLAEIRFRVTSSARFSNAALVWKQLRLEIPSGREESEGDWAAGESSDSAAEREQLRMKDRIRNVVFIVLDAARPDHFGCYGDDRGMTPNIDKFAESSIVFRNAIAAAPYTIASISTLFTGLLPEAHGVRTVVSLFPEDLENMPRAFKRSGYYTLTLAGTQFVTRKFGLSRDCDEVIYLRDPEDKEGRYTTMDVAAMEPGIKAAAESGKPAFIYAHLLPPHWPYRPPAPFNSRFIARPRVTYWRSWKVKSLLENGMGSEIEADIRTHHGRYMNNLFYADYVTEQLLELLRRYELFEDSLIILTSDHGESFGEHDSFGHNTTVYESMIRIPLVVHVPGVEPRDVEQQVGLVDFFPTLVELLDLETEATHFDGRSIAPMLAGREQEPTDYYYARATSTKLIFTLRGERYKYVFDDYREALFDLATDPNEIRDISADHPVLATYLRQRGLFMVASNAALRTDEGKEVKLTPEEERELRNLGYLQ